MSRWEALTTIAAYLRWGLLDGSRPEPIGDVAWERLVEISSHAYVTPALAWCLRERSEFPVEARRYLEGILALNATRNGWLLGRLARISALLNDAGIEPVLLKGAAHLVDGVYPSPGARFLGDLDLLVPNRRSQDAVASLIAAGFEFGNGRGAGQEGPDHHLPMLIDRSSRVGVEIHVEVTCHPHGAVLPTDWFLQDARTVMFRGAKVRLASPTAAITHNVVHSQLQHSNYRDNVIDLRALLDFCMLRARHENAIDWAEVDRRFADAESGRALAAHLHLAQMLFGLPAPKHSFAVRAEDIAAIQRRIEAPRGAHLARLWRYFVSAGQRNPRRLLKLFQPAMWPSRMRLIRDALRISN